MQDDPDSKRSRFTPTFYCRRMLCSDGRIEHVARSREHRMDTVTIRLDDLATSRFDCAT
jgi:hypothetical protein